MDQERGRKSRATGLRFGLVCLASLSMILGSHAEDRARDARGLYWDLPYGETAKDGGYDAAIAEIANLHIRRIHLRLDGQPSPDATCATRFAYQGWSRPQLDDFIAALKEKGIEIVLTLSPAVMSSEYIKSLDEPIGLAAAHPGVDLEFDLAANWTAGSGPQGCEGGGASLAPDDAEAQLIASVEKQAPDAKIGISVAVKYFNDHQTIMKRADWIAPQLYDLTTNKLRSDVVLLESRYPKARIRPSIRADSNLESFEPSFRVTEQLRAVDPRADAPVIGGRRKLTFAADLLRRR